MSIVRSLAWICLCTALLGGRARGAQAQDDAAVRNMALNRIEGHLACTCFEGGELRIDKAHGLGAAECTCASAATVRTDLARSLEGLSNAQLADTMTVSRRLEGSFAPLQPAYERLFRYPEAEYGWIMDNVRCMCDGCKATVFFSKCNLGCAPAIVYKLRARIELALGQSRDQFIDHYLADHNASHGPREQITRDDLLPGKQKQYGWFVPALVMVAAGMVLLLFLRRWVGKGRRHAPTAPGQPQPGAVPMTAAQRSRLEQALEDHEDGW